MRTTPVHDRYDEPLKSGTTFAVPRPGRPSHMVQFYEDDDLLAASVARFIADGIASASPALVIARPENLTRMRSQLGARAVDVERAVEAGTLALLDAEETLARLRVNGALHRERFDALIGDVLGRLLRGDPSTPLRVYGEMVDLLCAEDDVAGALTLEGFWSEITSPYRIFTLCGYAIDRFRSAEGDDAFNRICDAHTEILVTDEDGADADLESTRRLVARLQRHNRALSTEIAYRKQVERDLRQCKRDLEDFCENAPEGMHRVSSDGRILWANRSELELLGWSREQYIGRHIAELHADPRLLADILARLRAGDPLSEHEARLRCRDGSTKHVVINSNVANEGGELVHTCFTRDITARKHAEDSLRILAEAGAVLAGSLDYESTLNTVCRMCVPRLADWAAVELKVDGAIRPVAVVHSDPQKIALAQDLWKRVSTRIDQPHGVAEVLRSGEPEIVREISDHLLACGIDDPVAREDIRSLGIRSRMTLPLLDGGAPIGAIILYTAESGRTFDRHDLPLAEELARRASLAIQNARLYEGAQTATRLKDEFLATISHELRTPLTSILGWARLLRAGNVRPENLEKALDSIERNSIAQVQLVEDLLDVSRIISGKLRLDIQSLSMAPLVEAAVDSIEQAMAAKQIAFSHGVAPDVGQIHGDPHRLQQVIWNLLSNAVKFTPRGGAVRLSVERVESCLRLTVSDTGQGMPSHILSSVFERFKQADGNTARVHGGLGLGLAIVRHIVELHGGTVEARSEGVGRGATFIVELPSAQARSEVVGPFRHRRSQARPQIERPRELQGLTVLVIDDERDTRELLAEVLQQCGCAVLTAAGTEEGLAILDRASPRVAVCDIGMPGLDGYEFIRQVRRRPPELGGRIVAVALTAYAGAEDRRRALRAGYQMHVAKPVEPAEFVTVMANLAQLAVAMS